MGNQLRNTRGLGVLARFLLPVGLAGLLVLEGVLPPAEARDQALPPAETGTGAATEGQVLAGPGGLGMVPSDPSKYQLVRLPARLPEGEAEALPSTVDLASSSLLLQGQPSGQGVPPVGDQQWTNTCTGWATSYYYKTYQEWLEHQWLLENGGADPDHIFSPSFVYNQVAYSKPDYDCGDGAQIGDAIGLIVSQGDLPYSQFDWNPYNCSSQPTGGEQIAALEYDGISYGAFFISVGPPYGGLQNHYLRPLKQWLADDDPFVLGFPVYAEFDNLGCSQAVMPPADPGTYRGLHAVAVIGYDDSWAGVGGFKIVNSYGEDWGCYGYGWLSYEFVRKYAWEAWWMTSNRRPWIAPLVADRYSPTIGADIVLDLSPYENDREDSGLDLKWYVEGMDNCTADGQGSANDVLIFHPSDSYTGYDAVTLVLEDSEGAQDRQQLLLGWFDLTLESYLPMVPS
jgi:hypothetical protein